MSSGDCVDHGQKAPRYGMTTYLGQRCAIHRKVYMESNAVGYTAIAGLVVMHSCDNPRCVNPGHLLLGTQKDNMADKHAKGRGNNPKGDTHRSSKVSLADRLTIAARFHAGETGKALAAEYGISPPTVSAYAKGVR